MFDDSRSDLDAALTDLSVAVGEVQRFVAGTRDKTAEQIQRLANVTQILVDHQMDLENILHVAPTAFANGYNIYDPDTHGAIGSVRAQQLLQSRPRFICGAIGAVANVTAAETGKLCAQYLGPALRQLNFNLPALPVNPFLNEVASPDKIIYTDPPGPRRRGPTPGAAETPPGVSAYTGLAATPRSQDLPESCCPPTSPRRQPAPAARPSRTQRHGHRHRERDIDAISAGGRRDRRAVRRRLTRRMRLQGINSLPLPGAVGHGPRRQPSTTSNSPTSVRWNRIHRS